MAILKVGKESGDEDREDGRISIFFLDGKDKERDSDV